MGVWGTITSGLRNFFTGENRRASAHFARVARTVGRSAPGRQSVDAEDTSFFTSVAGGLALMTPFSPDDYWRDRKLDAHTLDRITPTKLMELLAQLSPDVSRALWDFLLFMCPGWSVQCFKPFTAGTDSQARTPDPEARQNLLDFFNNLHGPYSENHVQPIEVIFGSLFMGLFLRGALAAELVLDAEGRIPLEIATPDPATLRARARRDAVRGLTWELGQFQAGRFVVLDRPTVFYTPLHPLPGNPYGRSPATPAVFSCLFLLGLLHDLRRVISQQGYPRLDIEIDFSKLTPPPNATPGSEAESAWVAATIDQITNYYAVLEPDDAFVHSDAVKINKQAVGTLDANSLGKLDELIKMIERMSVRGLKSMTVLFSINDASTETMVHRQWRIYVAGIKSLQHLAENLMERLGKVALQAQGIVADVRFRFSELLASDEFIDAQTTILKLTAARMAYDNGLISQDQQATMALGLDKADVATPRLLSQGETVNAQTLPSIGENSAGEAQKISPIVKRLLGDAVASYGQQKSFTPETEALMQDFIRFTSSENGKKHNGNGGSKR